MHTDNTGKQVLCGASPRIIKRALRKKIDDWASSVDNVDVKTIIRDESIVTGGSIASMLLAEPVKDYDVYFTSLEATKQVAKYYVEKFNKRFPDDSNQPRVSVESIANIRGKTEDRVVIWTQSEGVASGNTEYQYFEGEPAEMAQDYMDTVEERAAEEGQESVPLYMPTFMSQNSISLTDKIQIVIRFYGEPDEIHSNYDFVHATNWYRAKDDHLELKTEALSALLSRRLVYKGSLYPIASVFRAKKFIERGWRIQVGELLKMCWQISEIDLNDVNVLREQLTGVDVAYLHEIIKIVAEDKERKPGKDINSTWVATVIDRVFNA